MSEEAAALFLLSVAISGGLVLLSGSVLFLAGALSQTLTEGARQRLAGMGYLLLLVGIVAWLAAMTAVIIETVRRIPFTEGKQEARVSQRFELTKKIQKPCASCREPAIPGLE